MLFRWLVGLGVEDPVWDASSFTKNRDRLLDGEVASKFLIAVLSQDKIKGLPWSEHFSVDGTLLEAWARPKSFRPKDGSGEPSGPGRNRERDFHRERRPTTRMPRLPMPMLDCFAKGQAMKHGRASLGMLMENRHGLIVATVTTRA